jgi:hypothetical protein
MQEMRPHDNRLPARPWGYRNLIMTPDVDAVSKYKKKKFYRIEGEIQLVNAVASVVYQDFLT